MEVNDWFDTVAVTAQVCYGEAQGKAAMHYLTEQLINVPTQHIVEEGMKCIQYYYPELLKQLADDWSITI